MSFGNGGTEHEMLHTIINLVIALSIFTQSAIFLAKFAVRASGAW